VYIYSKLAIFALLVSVASAAPARADSVPAPLICGDVNNSLGLTSSDALAVLRAAVGQEVPLACGVCPAALVFGVTEAVPESSAFGANYLLGGPIEIGQTMTMTQFGLLSRAEGSHVRMGLYTNDGGKPGTLVIGTDSAEIDRGSHVIPVFATEIEAGDYWIMAVYDTETMLPGDDNDASTPVVYRDWNFGDPLPDAFGDGTTYDGQPMPYNVRGVP
jgi:hypothetical protein